MRLTAIVAAAGLSLLAGCSGDITDDDIRTIGMGEVRTLVERAGDEPGALLLIDPRSPRAFAEGHIPTAQNISLAAIDPKRRDPALDAHTNIVVYGDDPGSAPARAMAKKMMVAGYEGVRLFAGGLREWARGYEVERSGE